MFLLSESSKGHNRSWSNLCICKCPSSLRWGGGDKECNVFTLPQGLRALERIMEGFLSLGSLSTSHPRHFSNANWGGLTSGKGGGCQANQGIFSLYTRESRQKKLPLAKHFQSSTFKDREGQSPHPQLLMLVRLELYYYCTVTSWRSLNIQSRIAEKMRRRSKSWPANHLEHSNNFPVDAGSPLPHNTQWPISISLI